MAIRIAQRQLTIEKSDEEHHLVSVDYNPADWKSALENNISVLKTAMCGKSPSSSDTVSKFPEVPRPLARVGKLFIVVHLDLS